MSVNKGDDNQSNRPVTGAMSDALRDSGVTGSTQQTQAPDQRRPNATSRRVSGGSITNINSRLARPVSRNSAGDVIQRFMKAFTAEHEAIADDAQRAQYRLIQLDNNSVQIALSAILVTYSRKIRNEIHVAVYTLLVEGSAAHLNNRYENVAGQQFEVDVVPGDTFDDIMWQQIRRTIGANYGTEIILHNAGCLPIPSEMSDEDKTLIHRTWYTATQADYTVLDGQAQEHQPPFSVADVEPTDLLTASVDYNPLSPSTPTGLPIRSDLAIELRATAAGQANNGGNTPSIDLHSRGIQLARVDGYIDLIYNEPQQVIQQYGYPPQVKTQRYFPRYVMTCVDTQIDALTPELHLFCLAQATLASNNMAWSGVYLQSMQRNGDPLRDIGGVGYEVIQPTADIRPQPIQTKVDTFSRANLWELISKSIEPSLVYSLDVEETGADTFLTQTYIEAADGRQDAYDSIIRAANNLTNNHFAAEFPAGAQIARNDVNRIFLGYFIDENGHKQDLRKIDYLAMLNLRGGVDLQNVIDFAATYDNVEIPLVIRMNQRAKLLRAIIEGGVFIKGMARRITFSPAFMVALNTSIQKAGLTVRPQNVISDFAGSAGRAQYDAAAMSVNPNGISAGMYQHQGNSYGNAGRGMSGVTTFGRWGN